MRRIRTAHASTSRPAWTLAWAIAAAPALAAAAEPPRPWVELPRARAASAAKAPGFDELARRLGPSVVAVSTTDRPAPGPGSAALDPGGGGRSQGTGFIIHPSGLVLTNEHVLDEAAEVRVRLQSGAELPARLVGADKASDLALLAVEAKGPLPAAPLGDSDKVAIGEWVLAIGNPFGLDHSVTVGVVSGTGRSEVRPGGRPGAFHDLIQTDASINAGNSGGPLVNARGEVIGINTAMKAEAQGIAFAIPINVAKAIVPSLKTHGRLLRGWLGATTQPVTPALARALGIDGTSGALVAAVAPGSPAESAGLAAGDVILAADARPLRRAEDLDLLVAAAGPARRVALAVRRGAATRTVHAVLGDDPDDEREVRGFEPPAPRPSALGLTVSAISPHLARDLGVRPGEPLPPGVVVTQLERGSPAAASGLATHDRVLRVGDAEIATLDDYARAVRAIEAGRMVRLLVERDGKRRLWVAFERR